MLYHFIYFLYYFRFTVEEHNEADGSVSSEINIQSVTVQDGGLFQCKGQNELGSTVHVGQLYVYGKLKYNYTM